MRAQQRRGTKQWQRLGEEAADWLRRGLAIARGQGARWWELRTAVSLARLWRQQGRKEQARQLLASTHGWFTEGFDTPDLVQAAGLLRNTPWQ